MKTTIYKLLILSPILLIAWGIGGCAFGLVGDDGAKHISDNNTMVRQQQIAAQQAQQEAAHRAEIAVAGERTNQQRIDQLGASERLYSQQNYLAYKAQVGTDRMLIVMGVLFFLIVLAGGGWLFLYLRMNPQPHARQYQQLQWLDPVSLDMLQSQQAISVGWQITRDEFGRVVGQRVKGNGTVQRVKLLEDSQL